jgi:hypothetical protein
MSRSSRWWVLTAAVILSTAAFPNLQALAGGGKQSLTGEVGDAMCGRTHMDGAPAECTRTCVAHGSKFALIVKDKIYVLDTTDKSALATLDQQAGKNATVTGTLNGDSIEVSSVVAAK